MTGGSTGDRIRTTHTSFEVVLALQELGPARLSEIADHLGMAESTTHRHLNTLLDMRYVSRRDERYQLGLRFARLGRAALDRESAYPRVRSHVRRLARETGERAQFIAEDHGLGVYIAMETGENAVRVGFGVGRQIHLHCSSGGKSILAQYPRERVDCILDRWGLSEHTANTITDRETLYGTLDRVRERGYATHCEEHIDGLNAAGVPVVHEGSVLGALVVAGPAGRLKGERLEAELPDLLRASANELELNLAYADDRRVDHVVE